MMSENLRQAEVCIVINDKSQDGTAKHLSCDWLLHYKFITGKTVFFKSVNIRRSYRQNVDRATPLTPHSPLTFVLKDTELAG